MDYAAAIVMLRQALGRSVTIEWPPHQQTGGNAVLHLAGGTPIKIHLVPWGTRLEKRTNRVVWVIPRGNKSLRSALRQRDEQFVDLAGAVRIVQAPLHVDREDLSPIRNNKLSRQTDPFADKSSLLLRVMLESRDPTRVWGVRELASAANVGLATASDVLRTLAERQLVQIIRVGRSAEVRLTDPKQIFETWTRSYDWRLNRGVSLEAPVGDPMQFLPRLAKTLSDAVSPDTKWALTLQAGAALTEPYASWDRTYVYVDVRGSDYARRLREIAAKTGWRASTQGKVVLMAPYYTVSAWFGMRRVQRFPVVSDLQLVLDLWHYPMRGREQAEHLLARMFGRKG